jgi:hypothetical protein
MCFWAIGRSLLDKQAVMQDFAAKKCYRMPQVLNIIAKMEEIILKYT